MERLVPSSQQRRPLHPLVLAAEPVNEISAYVANLSSGVLGAAALWLLELFFFGSRGNMMRGERAPVDKYIPALSPRVQHTLQLLFLLALFFAIFPQFFSKFIGLPRRFVQSISPVRREK